MRSAKQISNRPDEPNWYRLYYFALLESNRARALPKIETAQKAIQERFEELRSESRDHSREKQDLRSAYTYLGLLIQYIGNENVGVLWD